jgi:hypothetical protein
MRRGRWIFSRCCWYIIPFEVMGRENCSLHFTPTAKRQKYGAYLEAWELLRRAGCEMGLGGAGAEALFV